VPGRASEGKEGCSSCGAGGGQVRRRPGTHAPLPRAQGCPTQALYSAIDMGTYRTRDAATVCCMRAGMTPAANGVALTPDMTTHCCLGRPLRPEHTGSAPAWRRKLPRRSRAAQQPRPWHAPIGTAAWPHSGRITRAARAAESGACRGRTGCALSARRAWETMTRAAGRRRCSNLMGRT
jgi:hypothetical protein